MSKPKRIQRKRTKGWKMPANTVYVGRPSPFGNPFAEPINPELPWSPVDLFRAWITYDTAHPSGVAYAFPDDRDTAMKSLPELSGKCLACWCKLDEPCHADVLLEIANQSPTPPP